ncbi:MAG: hypothetical protein GF411_13275 [Candidatus Lokiarchaeota archaeon]|nr:hypothetical protein [Candidatus Lokiarchaeota archaeon]
MVDEFDPGKASSHDVVKIPIDLEAKDLPCISCSDYTFYGCCRIKYCDEFIKWKEQNRSK